MGAPVFGGQFSKEIVFSRADYFIQARLWQLPSQRACYGQSRFLPHVLFPVEAVRGHLAFSFGCGPRCAHPMRANGSSTKYHCGTPISETNSIGVRRQFLLRTCQVQCVTDGSSPRYTPTRVLTCVSFLVVLVMSAEECWSSSLTVQMVLHSFSLVAVATTPRSVSSGSACVIDA